MSSFYNRIIMSGSGTRIDFMSTPNFFVFLGNLYAMNEIQQNGRDIGTFDYHFLRIAYKMFVIN